jgi:hypothetical protein
MASQVPAKKNTAFNLGLTLYLNTGALVTNPGTITAKISKDFGNYADIGTVTEEDSTYGQLKLALSADEMNADVVMIYVVDNTAGCVPYTTTIYTAAGLMDDIAGDVWDVLRADHTTVDTFGDIDLTSDVASAVWEVETADHTTAGTTGKAVADGGAAGDPWGTELPGAYDPGTAGQLIGDYIDAAVGTVQSTVTAIAAKTDNLPSSPAAVGSAMTLDSTTQTTLGVIATVSRRQ